MWTKNNYAGFVYTEIKSVRKLKFASFDRLHLRLVFRSIRLDKPVEFCYLMDKRDILNQCQKTRLYNFFIEDNIMLYYFDGDDCLLKSIFEISVVHLITKFAQLFSSNKQVLAKVLKPQVAKQFVTKHEDYSSRLSYDSVEEYLSSQTHFEVIVSLHNGTDRIAYFVNSTRRPVLEGHDAPTMYRDKSKLQK